MNVQQRVLERAAMLFDNWDLAAEWIARPSKALGGRRPADLLETPDGREAVEDLLGRLVVGTYS
jgi:putative toxin-antitoxin system antitoxin component (TIGR02293 family)